MLTTEQLQRIERNRQLALQRLQAKKLETAAVEKPKPPSQLKPQSQASIKPASAQPAPFPAPKQQQISLNLQLISRNQFTIQPILSQDLALLYRKFGAQWNPDEKRFELDLKHWHAVTQELNALRRYSIDQPPKNAMNRLLQQYPFTSLESTPQQNHLRVLQSLDSPKLRDALMPFQQDALVFAVSHRQGRVLIADDMGLGKTLQAMAIALYYRVQWPLLIICPSSVRMTWAEQLRNWLGDLLADPDADIKVVFDGRSALDNRAQVVIISYELAVKKAVELQKRRFSVVIADESHVLKNGMAKRTQAVLPLLQQADRCILLSGTPALSRPSELFNQISAVDPKLFTNFFEFGLRYCDAKQSHFGWDFSGASHLEELKVILSTIMIRRIKADVLTTLPPKIREHVFLDVGAEKRKLKQARAEDLSRVFGGDDNSTLQLFRDTAFMKIPAVTKYVGQLLKDTEEKFLVFAHHKEILDECEFQLVKKRVDYIRIDGRTSSAKRQEECNRFQNQDSCRVALLSITAAGVGITLTAARLLIFTELFWQPGLLMQAEDRCHRIGQTREVIARYLLAKGTIDDVIWPLLLRKLDILQQAGLSKKDLPEANFPKSKSMPSPSDEQAITRYFSKSTHESPPKVIEQNIVNAPTEVNQNTHTNQPPVDPILASAAVVQNESENQQFSNESDEWLMTDDAHWPEDDPELMDDFLDQIQRSLNCFQYNQDT